MPISQHVFQNTGVVKIGGNVSPKETNEGGDTGIRGHSISKAEEQGKPSPRPPCAHGGNKENVKSWYYCRPCGGHLVMRPESLGFLGNAQDPPTSLEDPPTFHMGKDVPVCFFSSSLCREVLDNSN